MLMTVLFYTTGSICAIRATTWLALHALFPVISRVVILSYSLYSTDTIPVSNKELQGGMAHDVTSSSFKRDIFPGSGSGSDGGQETGEATSVGLLFKLVRTAAGHDLFVPVPIRIPISALSTTTPPPEPTTFLWRLIRHFLFSTLVGAGGVAAYYFAAFQFQNSVRNRNLNLKASTISRITASPQTQATVKLPYTPCGSTGPSVTATRTRSSSSASSSPSSSSSTLAIVQVQGGPLFPITPSTNTDPETRTGTVMGSAVNDDDNDHHPTTQTKLKLNPAAPAFTPSPSPSPSPVSPASIMAMMTTTHHRVLDPTARAFAPRGGASLGDDSAPSSPADSVGPATPSPIPASVTTPIRYNTFAFSARLARVGKSGGGGGGVGSGRVGIENGKTAALHQQLPVGVGKMRVVRPEEVVIGEKRAGEVFVFF